VIIIEVLVCFIIIILDVFNNLSVALPLGAGVLLLYLILLLLLVRKMVVVAKHQIYI